MKGACIIFVLLFALSGCGNGNGQDNTDVLVYMGLSEGKVWNYIVQYQAFELVGKVKVVEIDKEYKDGVDAYEIEFRQSNNLVATRWYEVNSKGLFLLGEGTMEGPGWFERTFVDPVKIIPYPDMLQSWNTTTEMEEGGSETHRFDNAGIAPRTVPAGTFDEAYHLVHTRTDKDSQSYKFDEYFVVENWYIEFEYPEEYTWKLE